MCAHTAPGPHLSVTQAGVLNIITGERPDPKEGGGEGAGWGGESGAVFRQADASFCQPCATSDRGRDAVQPEVGF